MTTPVDEPQQLPVAILNEDTERPFIRLAEALEAQASPFARADELPTSLLFQAAAALRVAATLAGQDQCRMEAPYKRMYRIREPSGDVILTCEHAPPHRTKL
ncbi:hypothetical protein FJQ54_12645 [Sandaracinobacter neustonicus]|uniref:Uncharacterized protein n=1 Tax=Sandaracinobacter neustonicus TaxID=1715348 RepID=A0A501XHK3_9SPHN|nr:MULTISPECIES: hypothetical protein [Alphaproteobacteria]TPE59777.1 hypothetical protein FJQ54_12645 [Sandaracinobacter neustonicus]HBI18253.1 hypothetical protein [Brevundimonas sp.]